MAYNTLSLEQKLLSKARREGECLVWFGQKDEKGYGRLRLDGRLQRVHRLVYELRFGQIPDGQVIRHRCDNPSCIDVDHLETGSQHDNVQDMLQRNRANKARGEKASRSKLNAEQVNAIRSSYISRSYGYGAHALGKKFGVSKAAIQAILRGDSWKHIPCA